VIRIFTLANARIVLENGGTVLVESGVNIFQRKESLFDVEDAFMKGRKIFHAEGVAPKMEPLVSIYAIDDVTRNLILQNVVRRENDERTHTGNVSLSTRVESDHIRQALSNPRLIPPGEPCEDPLPVAASTEDLTGNPDARAWAKAFQSRVGKDTLGCIGDLGFLIGWFANAIETGKGWEHSRQAQRVEAIKRAIDLL